MSITSKSLVVKKNLKIKERRETGSFPIVSNQDGIEPVSTKEEASPKRCRFLLRALVFRRKDFDKRLQPEKVRPFSE